jgi:hypothetical protein
MDSSSCGAQEKGSKTVAGEIFGTDGQHKQTQEMLCQEYILQSDHVIYRIRPKDDKHPVLLPIGETAQFRISKDKLILRVPELNNKEHEYIVVSMTRARKKVPRNLPATTDFSYFLLFRHCLFDPGTEPVPLFLLSRPAI